MFNCTCSENFAEVYHDRHSLSLIINDCGYDGNTIHSYEKIESDITKVSPGHGLFPQGLVSVLLPCMQSPSSLMQSLFLLCLPPPQVFEHKLQLPHFDQSVSGGSTEKDWLRIHFKVSPGHRSFPQVPMSQLLPVHSLTLKEEERKIERKKFDLAPLGALSRSAPSSPTTSVCARTPAAPSFPV